MGKKLLERQKRFRDNRRLTESEVFIYPVGIKSAHKRELVAFLLSCDNRYRR